MTGSGSPHSGYSIAGLACAALDGLEGCTVPLVTGQAWVGGWVLGTALLS